MAKNEEFEKEIIRTSYDFLMGVEYEGVTHRTFEITEMTGEDEEAISKPDIKANGAKVLRTILERCVISIGTLNRKTLGMNKWKELIQSMSVGDQDIALLRIREETSGREIEVNHTCPSCKESLKTIIETDELEIMQFSGDKYIEFNLPKGYTDSEGKHTTGKMRYPNGFDREILDQIARKNMGIANTMLLTRCIVEFDGLKIHDDLIRKLSLKDREYLINLVKENQFGVKLETDVSCTSCGESFKGNLNASNFI